jgi:[ribosomal protein S5]-alanine N-acetyltransferase
MHSYNLSTERLELRLLEKGDAEILWPFVSDPELSKDMSWEYHRDLSETQEFIDATIQNMQNGKSLTWCIFFNNRFCGIFSLIAILKKHRALTYNRAELAYWLGASFQGRGIMTEAGKKIIDFAFNELKLNKLLVGHHIQNKNSENLILRFGFNHLYTEERVFMKNDNWITCKFYELQAINYFNK